MRSLTLLLTFVLTLFSQPVTELVHRFPSDMELPTDVAILTDGRICVADGVNSRVLVFRDNGSSTELKFAEMTRPLGLASDKEGGLLITDTESDAIFILDSQLSLRARLPLNAEIDATDVLAVGDDILWVVDNDGHQVIVMDRLGHIKERLGNKGTSGPTFNYPSTITGNSNNQVFICDVLNGRIQLFDHAGIYRGQIADWGITRGTFFRPKGVAANQSGAFAVSDSFTGVIHYFTNQSNPGSVLPIRFENPLGLAWDKQGLLWVVESGTGDLVAVKVRP